MLAAMKICNNFTVLGQLPPPKNFPPNLKLTLTLTKILTLTGGGFSWGTIVTTPFSYGQL